MPDVDLGTISTKIDIDTSLVNQRVDEVLTAWDSIKKGTSQASVGMGDKMVSALDQYQKKLDIIADKLERQRHLIEQLEAASSKTAVGPKMEAEVSRATAQLEKEKIKLKELEAQFEKTYDSQRDFILSQDKVAKKAEETAKKLDLREAGANMKVGTDLAASGLRTLDQIAPGVAGNIGNIITQVNTARMAMDGMGSTSMKWAMGISAAVGVATTLVMAGIKQMQEAEEERQRVFEEGVQKMQEYADNIRTLETNIRILQNEKSTVDELKSARDSLSSTFPELIAGYTEEGEAILMNSKALDDYLERLKERERYERQRTIREGKEEYENYKNNQMKLKQLQESIDRQKELLSVSESYSAKERADRTIASPITIKNDLETLQKAYDDLDYAQQEQTEKASNYFKAQLKDAVTFTNQQGMILSGYENLDATQRYVFNSMLQNMTNAILKGASLQDTISQINNILSDPAAMEQYTQQIKAATAAAKEQERINTILTDVYGQQPATVGDLSDAYKTLANGVELSDEKLQQLAQTFPQIKEYIKETNDLTLDSGRIITEVMGSIDYSDQISQLEDLSGAYQRLADGQQLSVAQLYELAQAYPMVADHIAATNDMTLQEGDILRQIFEIRKQTTIAKIDNDRREAESQVRKTESIIANIKAEIEAMGALYTAYSSPFSYEGFKSQKLTKELKEQQVELEKQKNNVKAAQALIDALNSSSANIDSIGGSKSSSKSSSAKTSTRNEALQEELKLLEHKKKMDQVTSQEELDWLQRLQRTYSLNADEKMDLEYRVYSVKKKLEEEAEKAATDRLNAEYKAIENKKKLGRLSAKEELAWLGRIQKTYRMNTEERMELEIKLYNLKKQLHEEDVKALDTLGNAVTEALKNQYEQQKKQEQDRINESIDSWKTWEDETCKAIQGQIDALDKLEQEQESAEQRAEYEKKRQETQLLMRFEQDEYQRKQYQKELNRLDAEEQKRLDEAARQAEKDRLQAELDKVKETSSQQQEALQKELNQLDETYDKLTSSLALRAEAEKAIMESSQKEIIQMIKDYAPEYDLAGQSIGEKLAEGFQKKAGGIVDYFETVVKSIQSYQNSLAAAANQAADSFWAARKSYDQQIAAGAAPAAGSGTPVVMTVNFNQPVQSPVEMKRALDKVATDLARRIGG